MTRSTGSLEERSPAFVYRGGRTAAALHCEQLEMERLARRFGTPLYVYSATAIRERVAAFRKAFERQSHTLCYAMKANENLSILRMLHAEGCGFDIVSGGELRRALQLGADAAAGVVFSGVGKQAEEMDAALDAGILLFNLESEGELELLAARAARMKKTARVSFRVNPDVAAETHPYISTGLQEHKFGVSIAAARELYRKAASYRWLDPVGVSAHIGSQIFEVEPFAETIERLLALIRDLTADGLNISFIDIGGGLGIRYQGAGPKDFERRLKEYAAGLMRPMRGTGLHLLLEPGRALVASAGALVTRVLYVKENGGRRFAIVDAAMNDLIRPALYDAHHEIVPVHPRRGAKCVVDVVGPICESGDFLARERALPPVEPGDLLAVLDAGAYGMSQASNYNSRGRAAEVLVEGSKVRLIRRRESFDELIRNEV